MFQGREGSLFGCLAAPCAHGAISSKELLIQTRAGALHLKAKSSHEAEDWVDAVQRALQRCPYVVPTELGGFAPPRVRSRARWYVDGEDTFRAMYDAINSAEHEILIAGWWICPDLQLLRPPESESSEASSCAAEPDPSPESEPDPDPSPEPDADLSPEPEPESEPEPEPEPKSEVFAKPGQPLAASASAAPAPVLRIAAPMPGLTAIPEDTDSVCLSALPPPPRQQLADRANVRHNTMKERLRALESKSVRSLPGTPMPSSSLSPITLSKTHTTATSSISPNGGQQPIPESNRKQTISQPSHRCVDPAETQLAQLLQRKAAEGVHVYLLIFQEQSIALPNDSVYAKAKFQKLHDNIHVLRHGSLFWTHHEKIIITDRRVAFVGGLDVTFGRFDTATHSLIDPKGARWPGMDYYNPTIKVCHAR